MKNYFFDKKSRWNLSTLNQLQGGDNSSSTSKTWNSYTKDGTLDRHGRPANKGKTGGWKTGMLLLGNTFSQYLSFIIVFY